MSDMKHAETFRELIVYEKMREIAATIFELTKSFPREETYSLIDQIRRASRSVGAQIAEAWGKRRYEKHFVSKLTDAHAEQLETQHWVDAARDCGYLDPDTARSLIERLEEVGRMLNGMIRKSHLFCSQGPLTAREERAEYFTS